MIKTNGIAASMGVAIAKAYHLSIPDLSFEETTIQDPAEEVKRFDAALEQSISELEKIRTHTKENIDAEHAEIFSAHIQHQCFLLYVFVFFLIQISIALML